ncbi:BON domain-containing protein [Hoeflea ulvae]|uniref:BON domain-containing protein n=1 Tax=Hoeflea ulvae TaxID=2983764 RepID=A0ABT3YM06_9HYPH|nr:BON domain-containing protein [Hoeflea ulvae]MCY0096934.1 BON domain-containing protein [Hoeflea ulvae]
MVFKPREYFGDPADVERKRNAELEHAVASALAASGRIDATDVAVTVLPDACIVLSGWVNEEDEIRRCIETAMTVAGVHRVESKILARGKS